MTDPMQALSFRQPQATLVALGAKQIDTRSWGTSYRGPLAIHASKQMTKAEGSLCWEEPFRTALEVGGYKPGEGPATNPFGLPLGAVIAVAQLVDIYPITHENQPPEPEYSFGDYGPGRFAWILRDVYQLPEPIPARGRLGLWEWTPPSLPTLRPLSQASH
jgi:activating signal cointegrator 1